MSTDTTDTVVTLTSDRIDLLRRRVRAGSEMLDAKSPGWWELINFSRLDIRDVSDCILGQIFGEYYDACRALDLSLPYASMMGADRAPRLFGFNISTMELYDLYRWERGHGEEILTSAFNAEATALKDLWMQAARERAAHAA